MPQSNWILLAHPIDTRRYCIGWLLLAIWLVATPTLAAGGATRITVHVHDGEVAAGQPDWKSAPPVRAMVWSWIEDADGHDPLTTTLAGVVPRVEGWLVSESRPLVPPGRWTEGRARRPAPARPDWVL